MTKSFLCISIILLFVVPAALFGGTQVATAYINFDEEELSIVEIGFTGNTVTSMDTAVTQVDNTYLKETGTSTFRYTLETSLYAYWKIISTTDCSVKIYREPSFIDANSSDPNDVLLFDMSCGGITIPANSDTVIFNHKASLTPEYGYLPINVTTIYSSNLKESFYYTTLTLKLVTE